MVWCEWCERKCTCLGVCVFMYLCGGGVHLMMMIMMMIWEIQKLCYLLSSLCIVWSLCLCVCGNVCILRVYGQRLSNQFPFVTLKSLEWFWSSQPLQSTNLRPSTHTFQQQQFLAMLISSVMMEFDRSKLPPISNEYIKDHRTSNDISLTQALKHYQSYSTNFFFLSSKYPLRSVRVQFFSSISEIERTTKKTKWQRNTVKIYKKSSKW